MISYLAGTILFFIGLFDFVKIDDITLVTCALFIASALFIIAGKIGDYVEAIRHNKKGE